MFKDIAINKNNKEELLTPENNYDLNRVPGNGFLIFPLSINRLNTGQSPKTLIEFIKFFERKLIEKSFDVIFLYTNGLYFNSSECASSIRRKTNTKMLTHKQELLKILKKENYFPLKSIHFLPWDYLLLQTEVFNDLYAKLQKLKVTDPMFKYLTEIEIGDRSPTAENYDFIIEETLITYLIRQKMVSLPYALSHPDGWRLIIYQGGCLKPDVYLHNKKILNQNGSIIHLDNYSKLFSASMYNMEKKELIDYRKVTFPALKKITLPTSVT